MQQQPRPAALPAPITTAQEALALVTGLRATMAELTGVLQEETALVRTAKVKAAQPLEARKAELSRRYLADLGRMKLHREVVRAHAARGLAALEADHAAMQEALEVNLAVLATAHAVAEGIIRHVSATVEAKRSPTLYGANGRTAAPPPRAAAPVAIVRSL
ncbi:hypothetical protein [Phreatobacter sp.]|uniref:hypothetical protein n=1 Tax=Phreatobacter sp. TaxID=1966341 RepID=UPI0022BAD5C5|nr:hypothetical protein [Phreatobacter sp.]MCZ8314524.1 hypothetical protein [Phreatobacter sp.]